MTDADALMVRDLSELIAALDRRTPHLERSTEADIARSANALRDVAVRHIATLVDAPLGGAGPRPDDR